MNDRIVFLGTGGDTLVIGKQLLRSGGIVIEADNMQFHIDPGPGSLLMARQYDINPRNTTALFISGPDINLCNDVNCMIDAMTHSGLDKTGVLVANELVYNGNEEIQPYITKLHKTYLEKSIALAANSKVGINDVEIRTLPTFQNDNIGFRIVTSKFALTYSSVTGYDDELIEHYKNTDILILHVLNPRNNKTKGHLCTEEAVKIAEKIKPKMLILTGFGIKMYKSDILHETRTIQKRTGIQTLAARDGMSLNPLSYNVQMKQKTLRHF